MNDPELRTPSASTHNMPTPASAKFEAKDLFSLIIAAAALLVSVLTFYLGALRHTDDVSVIKEGIAKWEYDNSSHQITLKAEHTFVILNSGNRSAAVFDAHYLVRQNDTENDLCQTYRPNDVDFQVPISSVLKASDILMAGINNTFQFDLSKLLINKDRVILEECLYLTEISPGTKSIFTSKRLGYAILKKDGKGGYNLGIESDTDFENPTTIIKRSTISLEP